MALATEIGGLWAAVLIPRDKEGELDEEALRRSIAFLGEKGVRKVVLNGATGEYCLTTTAEFESILAICRQSLDGRGDFLCGIGAAGARESIALGRIAVAGGARALLLPMPHFFPYAQNDLIAYCERVAGELDSPIMLYNLPRFTTPLERSTVEHLIDTVSNIVGVKDSSGSLDILAALSPAKARRIVGDDRALVRALDAGVCDGVISGVAGVLPELMQFLYFERDSPTYADYARNLDELIDHLSIFPTPWGLKLIADIRGVAAANFAQPLSPERQSQAAEFRTWFARQCGTDDRLLSSVQTHLSPAQG